MMSIIMSKTLCPNESKSNDEHYYIQNLESMKNTLSKILDDGLSNT